MPVSDYHHIVSNVVTWVEQADLRSVLGIGFGK